MYEEMLVPCYKGDSTRYTDGSGHGYIDPPAKVKPAKYVDGLRIDGGYPATNNPLLCKDGKPRLYRSKMTVFPEGVYEMSVNYVDPDMLEAMGQAVRPCDMLAKDRTEEEQAQRDVENKARALRLTRQRIRQLLKMLRADHLLTFTYRETMQDMEKLQRDYKEFCRLFHVKYPDWKCVTVFEKQRSEETDWSYHLHLGVHGKQDIKWLLHCWLRAIGQPEKEVNDWYIRGIKLHEKSVGAVNVQAPNRCTFGKSSEWKADRLAGYMSKYISKEFDTVSKSAKKYWASRGIEKPVVIKTWFSATNFHDACVEAFKLLHARGVTDFDRLYAQMGLGIIWFAASTEISKRSWEGCEQGVAELLDD